MSTETTTAKLLSTRKYIENELAKVNKTKNAITGRVRYLTQREKRLKTEESEDGTRKRSHAAMSTDDTNTENGNEEKKRKLSSVVVPSKEKEDQNKSDEKTEHQSKLTDVTKRRGRLFMGHLMGHLAASKTELEKTKEKVRNFNYFKN